MTADSDIGLRSLVIHWLHHILIVRLPHIVARYVATPRLQMRSSWCMGGCAILASSGVAYLDFKVLQLVDDRSSLLIALAYENPVVVKHRHER